jgi:hypothetical protein
MNVRRFSFIYLLIVLAVWALVYYRIMDLAAHWLD